MFDLMYTGSTVPDGMGGSSFDHSRIPQPSREQEQNKKTAPTIIKTEKKFFLKSIPGYNTSNQGKLLRTAVFKTGLPA
jgi:hypothetical protein